MSVVGTMLTAPNRAIREDLENVISRVSPEKTQFTSMIGSVNVTQPNHEWLTENLDAPNPNNANFEGAAASNAATTYATRLGNYTQRMEKVVQVSGTSQAVKAAGDAASLDHQLVLRGIELRRDFEARFLGNYGSAQEVAGTSPRVSAGAQAFLITNTSRGPNGLNGGAAQGSLVAAATPATSNRASTEALFKTVMASAFVQGARPTVALMDATQKQNFSQFTGIALNRRDTGDKMVKIVGAADVYISDFGAVTLVPHEYHPPHTILVIEPDMWAVGTLRGVERSDLAKVGDSDRILLTAEKTLVCKNELASGIVADLT